MSAWKKRTRHGELEWFIPFDGSVKGCLIHIFCGGGMFGWGYEFSLDGRSGWDTPIGARVAAEEEMRKLTAALIAAGFGPEVDEPTDAELRRIAWHMSESAHMGGVATCGECPADAEIPEWRMAEARAAYALGARHDGRGNLHGPVESLARTRKR